MGRSRGPATTTFFAPTSFGRVTRGPAVSPAHNETFEETVTTLNVGTTYAKLATIVFNPGLRSTFPRLYAIASRYKQYQVKSATIVVRPTTSTGVSGKYIIIPNYATVATPPLNFIEAANVEGNVTSSLWIEANSPMDIKATRAAGPRKYVRDDGTSPNDTTDYDCCTWYIYGSGSAAVNDFATVLIKYNIDFYVPTVDQTGALPVDGSFYQMIGNPPSVQSNNTDTSTLVTPDFIEGSNDNEPVYSITTGAVVPKGGYWEVMEDGIYECTGMVDTYSTYNNGEQRVDQLQLIVNDELIDASKDYEYNSPYIGVGGTTSIGQTMTSSIIMPLAKGSKLLYDWTTDTNDTTVATYMKGLNVAFDLVGALT